jgi:magnesium transporter
MEPTPKADAFLEELQAVLRGGEQSALEAFAADVRPQQILEEWDELEPAQREVLLRALPADKAAELFSNLAQEDQPEALHAMTSPVAKLVLEELDPDDLADTLQNLEAEHPAQASSMKALLEPETLAIVEALGQYEEEEAGGLMTPHFISLRASMTVDRVLAFLRRSAPDAETIYYLYVVDEGNRLQGVLSLRDLIVSSSETPIREIMDPDVVSIPTNTDQEEVARIMADYDFSVLPVVDERGSLVGIITVDDVLDVVEDEATEDIHRLGAAPIDIDYVRASAWLLFRKRAKWLILLVVSMTLTFNVISHYEGVIEEVVILAAFIPLLIGTGGNVGAQVATLVVRALATRELEISDYYRVLAKEVGTGALLGLAFGVFMTAYVLVLDHMSDSAHSEPRIAVALGITMVLIALTANLVGASLPFLFRRLGIDPALTSSPGITTVMDVVGLLIYFRVVIWVLGPMLTGGG